MKLPFEVRQEYPVCQYLFDRLQLIRSGIIQWCSNKNNAKYKNYGGRGVTFDLRWRKMENFIEDVDKIDGWNLDQFMRGKLQLDKDQKFEGNKLYSKDTCSWVSPEQNIKVKPSYQKPFYLYDYRTKKLFKSNSITEFIKDWDELKENALSKALLGGKHRLFDYMVWYQNEECPHLCIFEIEDTETGEKLSSLVASRVESHFGLGTGSFYKVERGINKSGVVRDRYKLSITVIEIPELNS